MYHPVQENKRVGLRYSEELDGNFWGNIANVLPFCGPQPVTLRLLQKNNSQYVLTAPPGLLGVVVLKGLESYKLVNSTGEFDCSVGIQGGIFQGFVQQEGRSGFQQV